MVGVGYVSTLFNILDTIVLFNFVPTMFISSGCPYGAYAKSIAFAWSLLDQYLNCWLHSAGIMMRGIQFYRKRHVGNVIRWNIKNWKWLFFGSTWSILFKTLNQLSFKCGLFLVNLYSILGFHANEPEENSIQILILQANGLYIPNGVGDSRTGMGFIRVSKDHWSWLERCFDSFSFSIEISFWNLVNYLSYSISEAHA